MATGERVDPYRGFNFRVEIDGTSVAAAREGTDPEMHVRKLTGLRKYANLMPKRGITKNRELWNWYRANLTGAVDRRSGAIVLQDEDRNDVARWTFSNGWICKWEGPAMNATANEVAIESIEICVEKVE